VIFFLAGQRHSQAAKVSGVTAGHFSGINALPVTCMDVMQTSAAAWLAS
jgi:hypothetical protein